MAKLVSVDAVAYDKDSNTLDATLTDANGEKVNLQIDGFAFATLMGMANLKNAVANHHQKGRELPWFRVAGIQVGAVSNHTGDTGFGLTLLVEQMGLLNFLLPGPIEKSLRDKLQAPQTKH
jgi:hypothetical protein